MKRTFEKKMNRRAAEYVNAMLRVENGRLVANIEAVSPFPVDSPVSGDA